MSRHVTKLAKFLFCRSLSILAIAVVELACSCPASASEVPPRLISNMVGIQVFEMYPYKYPYSPRTWSVDDWRGYASGLKKLGYNTIMIWPVIETMPQPLTASDRDALQKDAQIIHVLHGSGMHVLIWLTANISASPVAASESFSERHFYRSQHLVNPADSREMGKLMAWREMLISTYFKAADGFVILDSDPGGYSGSSNAEFLSLLKAHRDMLDRVRPGLELDYWAWIGWAAFSERKSTGVSRLGTQREFAEVFDGLKQLNPEPWGIGDGLQSIERSNGKPSAEDATMVERLGFGSRAFSVNYGSIESEPSLPITHNGDEAYRARASKGARGMMGNTQTPVAQLPSTFAFARGALGQSATDQDYEQFADRLIHGKGHLIFASWKALDGANTDLMRQRADELRKAARGDLRPGELHGLVLGGSRRFLEDLALQLDFEAATQNFIAAQASHGQLKPALSQLGAAATAWVSRTGYQNWWILGLRQQAALFDALRKLHAPKIDAVVDILINTTKKGNFEYFETCGPKLAAAIRETAEALPN